MKFSLYLEKLRKKHEGDTIYIVGTGPSLRFYPPDFFKNKVCIGLNKAWETFNYLNYYLTIHPETIPKNYLAYAHSVWITKKKDWLSKPTTYQLENTVWFKNNKDVKDFSSINTVLAGAGGGDRERLYVGRGIHTAAVVLAAATGASAAVLCGIDLSSALGQHSVSNGPTRFNGMPPDGVYDEYYHNLTLVRSYIKNILPSFSIFSLSPYLGLDRTEEELVNLSQLTDQQLLPNPKDESTYQRTSFDFPKDFLSKRSS